MVAKQPQPAAAARARARPGTRASRLGDALSAQPQAQSGASEAIGGLVASLSILASLLAVAYRPGRLVPFALLLALLAAAIGGRHRRLAGLALAVGGVCFVLGMALAVLTDHPLY